MVSAGEEGGRRKGEETEVVVRVFVVDADAMLDGHGQRDGLCHGRQTLGDQLWLRHEAGPERLHAEQ